MGIAISILEELRKSECLFLVTTHYPEVKEYVGKTRNIINARMTFDKETLRPTYQMVIGEAGQSCAFYIADRLGMPTNMLKTAIRAAYGQSAVETYPFSQKDTPVAKQNGNKLSKLKKQRNNMALMNKFKRGDSVMIYPDKKIGIVCEPINKKGVLRVQMPNKKIWINHKRVKHPNYTPKTMISLSYLIPQQIGKYGMTWNESTRTIRSFMTVINSAQLIMLQFI